MCNVNVLPRLLLVLLAGILAVAGCDVFGSDESSDTYDVVTRFEADKSGPAATAAMARESTPRRYRLAHAGPGDEVCGGGEIICLTPETLAGRIYAGGLMVGGNNGTPGYHITTIGATPEVRLRPDLGRTGTLTFDVANTTDFSGNYTCCGGTPYPADEDALISRIELNFDYLDMAFTVPDEAGGDLAGVTYVLRQVYVDTTTAPDVNGAMYVGDKLIRRADETMFRWCDADKCTYTQRPANGVLKALDVVLTPERGGNAHYVTFSIPLENGETVSFTEEEAKQGNWRFHVAFDLTDAAVFEFDDWTEATSEAAIVRAFHLIHEADAAHSSVQVQLSKEAVAVEPAPESGEEPEAENEA